MPVIIKHAITGKVDYTQRRAMVRSQPKRSGIFLTPRYNETSITPPPVFDTDYQALLDRATFLGYTLPSSGQRTKQNQLVLDLKAAGVWVLLDWLYVFATDGDSNFATLNWKSPTTFQLTKVNTPAFTTNAGFTGDGVTSYLDTGWIPATHAVNYTLDSAAVFHYVNNNTQDNNKEYGCNQSSREVSFRSRTTTDLTSLALNSNSVNGAASTDSKGFWLNDRNGSAAVNHDEYKDDVNVDTSSAGSTVLTTTRSFCICGHNNAGSFQSSTHQIGIIGAGSSLRLSSTALFNAWTTYFNSL